MCSEAFFACLAECVANADDILGEMFLEEKTPTEEDIKVHHLVFETTVCVGCHGMDRLETLNFVICHEGFFQKRHIVRPPKGQLICRIPFKVTDIIVLY